jgi:AcrR family transcriptional regulator
MSRRPSRKIASEPRRLPSQQRSVERYDRVLAVAAAIVDERGVDAVTTNAIAEEAELPVGTIYQFFPNRETVLLALLERQLRELDARFGPLITGARDDAPIPETVAAVVDALARAYVEIPGLATLVQSLRGDPRYAEIANANSRQVADWVARLARRRVPSMKPARAAAIAAAAVEAADGVLMAWLRELRASRDREARALLDELRALLTAYLSGILAHPRKT